MCTYWNRLNELNVDFEELLLLLLFCSHSSNDVPPEPQRNVSIAAVRGAVRPSKNFEESKVAVIYIQY